MFNCRHKKPAELLRILWRGVAGVVEIRKTQPFWIVNHHLTFKPVFYKVYQNIAPPTIVSLGQRPRKGAFFFGERIITSYTSYHTALSDKVKDKDAAFFGKRPK